MKSNQEASVLDNRRSTTIEKIKPTGGKPTGGIKNIIITGPTATGKTHLAVELAKNFSGEIISVDSRQVYSGLDIGTGKDISEYNISGESIPYHLIDVIDPKDDYNLLKFRQDVSPILSSIHKRGKLPILSGGTPLYIDSLISDYKMQGGPPDEKLRSSLNKLSTNELLGLLKNENNDIYQKLKDGDNRNRMIRSLERARATFNADIPIIPPEYEWLILGVFHHRKEVHRRIEARLDARLKEGMIEEVELLHKNGLSWERLEFFGLEYKYISLYLQNKSTYNEMRERLLVKIRQFAKRQDIWFRKMERAGHVIHWLKNGDIVEATKIINLFLNNSPIPSPEIKISEIDYGLKK